MLFKYSGNVWLHISVHHISVIKLVVGYDGIHPSVIFTDGFC